MKQPELGKKIAELRQLKGLTQEELVNECNINVRTLQRIEAGEVTPRNYTIKRIFEVLDYDYFNATKELSGINGNETTNQGFTRFYNYTINFLKTNPMKKAVIITIPIVLIIIYAFYITFSEKDLQSKMIGTWEVCSNDGSPDPAYSNRGYIVYKIITEDSFMNTDILEKPQEITDAVWGTYSLDNDIYTEHIKYTSSRYSFLHKKNTNLFEVTIQGDLMFLKGINNNFTSTWKKVKN